MKILDKIFGVRRPVGVIYTTAQVVAILENMIEPDIKNHRYYEDAIKEVIIQVLKQSNQ